MSRELTALEECIEYCEELLCEYEARYVGYKEKRIELLRQTIANAKSDLAQQAKDAAQPEAGNQSYGVIDPDYARVFTIARCIAWQEGYAAMLHGSFTRDLDILLVPWTDNARFDFNLVVRRIAQAANLKEVGNVSDKPQRRQAYTFKFDTFGDPRFIDLSVVPAMEEPGHD